MVKELTPKKLQRYVEDYDYEVTIDQAEEILSLLDDYFGIYTSEEIQKATDYIVNKKESRFAVEFE